MGAKCCAPSSCKVRKRLLDEYETHEVYVPSRSTSQDPDVSLKRRQNNTMRLSVQSEGTSKEIEKTSSTPGVSLTLPRVKNHTIRSTDTVPIVRVDARRPPLRVETSHVVTGSLTRQLKDISGKSVVRDTNTGQTMAASQRQPPGKVTYQYKVNASERRVEYRYQSETLLYDFEETTKREQFETWNSRKRKPSNAVAAVTMIRKTRSLQDQADITDFLGTRSIL
ncbi:hypothetical protein CAEBREN_15097 [Caenorhabditis brenneri]|uniref:Uncharacterized protein n=1 Tax=Caenorhabditis brenneri TaxID=135651 RepID=G0NIF4_CAEBE|nr:hypothetical protein CAEBREN_15097 [Caenorhabditis brenneri]